MYELQYVPLALPFFLFLVGLFVFLVILILGYLYCWKRKALDWA